MYILFSVILFLQISLRSSQSPKYKIKKYSEHILLFRRCSTIAEHLIKNYKNI